MAKPATSELVLSIDEQTETLSLRNRLVKLIERDPGRTIHGVVMRTPEDSTIIALEGDYGIPVIRAYSIMPPKHNDPTRPQEPEYLIYEDNVVSVQEIAPEDVPYSAVYWGENCDQ